MNKKEENKKEKGDGKLHAYEVGYHIVPVVSIENLSGEVEKIKNFIAKKEVVVVSEEFPKMRELAYPISKIVNGTKRNFNTAYFGWIKFDAGETSVEEIKKFFDENENILRFIIINTVRENTIFSSNLFGSEKKEEAKSSKSGTDVNTNEQETKPTISQEELDKTIDKLIAE